MGLIRKEMIVEGKRGREKINVLFDTGASFSAIKTEIAGRIGDIIKYPQESTIKTATSFVKVNKITALYLNLNGCKIIEPFIVMDNFKEDMIIGADIMQRKKLIIDMEKDDIDTSKCEIDRI